MTATAALVALSLAQFTSLQLSPISFSVDTTSLSLVDKCNTVSTRHMRLTNTSRATLFITQGLVSGKHFNGALIQGDFGDVKPGEFSGFGAIYAPGDDTSANRGQFEILIRYHDSSVTEERERIKKLYEEKKAELDREAEKLEVETYARMERAGMKLRIEHMRQETQTQGRRRKAIEDRAALAKDYEREKLDYERGFFCTGCGRTRTDILKTESTFPHPNQQARSATREELRKLDDRYKPKLAQLKSTITSADEELRTSWRRLQERLRQMDQEHQLERMKLSAAVDDVKRRQAELTRQRDDLFKQLADRSAETRTVLVRLYGRCTKGSP